MKSIFDLSVIQLLSIPFVTLFVILLFISLFTKDKRLVTRLIGVSLIGLLAILANHIFVYSLSVVIIATLVTELDFLQNLSALFWGRSEYWDYAKQKLEQLKKQDGIAETKVPSPTPTKIAKAQEQQQQAISQTIEPTADNFLTLSFEIERMIRIAAQTLSGNTGLLGTDEATKLLTDKGLLTELGLSKVKVIREMTEQIIKGISEPDKNVLQTAMEIALDFYDELKSWMYSKVK